MFRSLKDYFVILLIIALFGCAAGSQTSRKTIVDPPDESLTPIQLAEQALKTEQYTLAIKTLEKLQHNHGPENEKTEDKVYYLYGLALNKTGRHQEAIEQLTTYIDKLAERGSVSHSAEAARFEAKQQLETARKAELSSANSKVISKELDRSQKLVQQQLATAVKAFTEPLTGIEMVLIPGGCYQMGDLYGEGAADELPVHEVCIDDFYLGRYEVTQQQWLQVMGYNPSKYQQGGNYPVDGISWQEAMTFSDTLSGKANNYRLPTEAEWEFAARSGGQQQKFSGSDNADEVAWYIDNSGRKAHPVGEKMPNGLGLHDMSGNGKEWCLDRYNPEFYAESPRQNPTGADEGSKRVRRGGGWGSKITSIRTSIRDGRDEAAFRNSSTGFRLALPVMTGGK